APVPVSFLVSGKVLRVEVREGESVEQGRLLAEIDKTDYTLGLRAAAAQTGQAKVALDRSRDEYGRMKFLYETRSLAGNDFEKFKAAYLSAKQQVDQAAANEKLARKRLSDASLLSPVSGFISKRAIEPGETASTGKLAFEIVRLEPVEIGVGVPETDVHLIRIGQKAEIRIPALPGEVFEGTVKSVNVSADPNTRTYLTRITVPNPRKILRVGMVAEAKIEGDRVLDLMTVPAETIVRDPQGATVVYVYFADRNRVYARRVGTGPVYGREIAIKSGLAGGEDIVVAGQEKLRDGAKVTIAPGADVDGPRAAPEKKEVRQ
ncbi:MAG: efflux RND transporter periplasmic adaptor subunit, partial [Desulfobacteraceae bacterium]|nr:efflux RND transporter periplasmic adaptor subunit [Desulfobacteraceae bacterium]